MEKDKLQLIKTIITLVDTEEGLKQIKDTVTKVLQTQWSKEEEDKKEFSFLNLNLDLNAYRIEILVK